MATGIVKWFNNAKGWGFIAPDDGSPEAFAHYSAISMDGFKSLKDGQRVQFTLVDGPKGPHAVDIRALDDSADAPPPPASPPQDAAGPAA